MPAWTENELDTVGRAGELRVAGQRLDDSYRKAIIIWQVRVGDSIYIRSVNGPEAAWFRGTQLRGRGRIEAGGVSKEVAFVRVDDLDSDIDAAYRAKYGRGSAVAAITSAVATTTTLRLDAR